MVEEEEMKHLGNAETAIKKLKFNFLELNRIGWGLGEDAFARETTETWHLAINVRKKRYP